MYYSGTLVVSAYCSACFPTIPALPTADDLDQKLEGQRQLQDEQDSGPGEPVLGTTDVLDQGWAMLVLEG